MTYRGHPEGCGCWAPTRGVDDHMLAPGDPESFGRALERAIGDAEWRHRVGALTNHAIRDTHTGSGWQTSVAEAYALAAELELPTSLRPRCAVPRRSTSSSTA